MIKITPIRIEWNIHNGFIVEIFGLDLVRPNIESSLFGLAFSRYFLFIEIFFFTIKVFEKYPNDLSRAD